MGVTKADRRPFVALVAANVVSQIGNMMTAVAVPWFVLETTGNAALVGLASAAIAIGVVLPAILGGPVVDRLGQRRTSVAADLLCSLTVLLMPLLHLAGLLEFWVLMGLVFVLSSINAQGDSGRMALLPVLAERAAITPERANAADRAAARTGQLVGPLVAGFLIAFIGPANVLFADAVTFATSAALIGLGVPRLAAVAAGADASAGHGYLDELGQGLRFVIGNRLILAMVLLATFGNLLDVPLLTVVLPVYASEVFGSAASLGVMMASFAGGALLGTIGFGVAARGWRWPRRLTLLTSWLLASLLAYGVLAAQLPLGLIAAAGLAAGIISGPINPILLTVVQRETPAALRGRVFGALNAMAQAGIPFGAAVVGLVIEGVGLIETIAGMGALYVAVLALMFAVPALRRVDAPMVAEEPALQASPEAAAAISVQARRCPNVKVGL